MKWPIKKLSELSEVITKGTTPTSLGFSYTSSGIRFLRAQNINYGNVNFFDDDLYIDVDTHRALARSQILNGDLLVSIAGSIGRSGIVVSNNEPLNCNQAVAIVRLKKGVNENYISHVLDSQAVKDQIRNSTVTGVISNLSLSQLGNLKIPLPPLAEQQRIAALLDTADRILKQRESAITKLDQLAQSVFVNMFSEGNSNAIGWVISEFEDVVSDITKQFDKVDSNQYMSEGKTPVIDQGADFICGYTNIVPSKKKQSQYHIIFGDHTRRLKFVDFDFILGADGTKVLLPKIEINIKYLFYYLSYLKIEEAGYSRHYKFLKRSMILLPPRNLQDKFASFVDVLEIKSKKMYEMKSQVAALISSLQHQSFAVN